MVGFKLYKHQAGAHSHVVVYVSDDGQNYALSGLLSMRDAEYQAFRHTLMAGALARPDISVSEIIEE